MHSILSWNLSVFCPTPFHYIHFFLVCCFFLLSFFLFLWKDQHLFLWSTTWVCNSHTNLNDQKSSRKKISIPPPKKMEIFTSLKQPSRLSSDDARIVNQETQSDFLHSGFLSTAGANYSHLRVSVCTCLPSFCLGRPQMSEEKKKKALCVFTCLSV